MKRLKKGFTLIELLVVIAIIGILATTLAPKLREQLAKAKDAKAIALLGAARTATQVILIDKLVVSTGNSITISQEDIEKKLDNKTAELLTDKATVEIGGSRDGAGGSMVYGGVATLVSSGEAITTDISATDDEVELNLEGPNANSTEGKLWINY